MSFIFWQIIFKNLTDNAKNIAANAKIEDMGRLFKTHISSKQDVKSTLTSVIEVSSTLVKISWHLKLRKKMKFPEHSLSWWLMNAFPASSSRRTCRQAKRLSWTFASIQLNNTFMLGAMDSRKRTSKSRQNCRAYDTLLVCTHKQLMTLSRHSTPHKRQTCHRREFRTHRHRKVCIHWRLRKH